MVALLAVLCGGPFDVGCEVASYPGSFPVFLHGEEPVYEARYSQEFITVRVCNTNNGFCNLPSG